MSSLILITSHDANQNYFSNGDSGQALLYVNARTTPVRWEIVGLVSFGPSPCGQANKPGVYTRVSSYMQWIRQNVI